MGVKEAHNLASKNDHDWLQQQGMQFPANHQATPSPADDSQETYTEKMIRIHKLVEEELQAKGLTDPTVDSPWVFGNLL